MAFAPWNLTMSSKNDCMSAGSQPKPVSVKRLLPFWNIQARATESPNSPVLMPNVPGNLVLNWAARVISESQVQVLSSGRSMPALVNSAGLATIDRAFMPAHSAVRRHERPVDRRQPGTVHQGRHRPPRRQDLDLGLADDPRRPVQHQVARHVRRQYWTCLLYTSP